MTDQETRPVDLDQKNYKNDGFAHTSWVIPKRTFDFNAHDWMQEGTLITCNSCPTSHSSSIPVDKMLIKEGGSYSIIPLTQLS